MDPKDTKDTITVLGPFRQLELEPKPRPATTQNNKHDGGSSSRTSRISNSLSPEHNPSDSANPPPNTPEPPRDDERRGRAPSSPPRGEGAVACGFCRTFRGPNVVCLHPGQPHKIVVHGGRPVVRVLHPPVRVRRRKVARPVGTGPKKTREKL